MFTCFVWQVVVVLLSLNMAPTLSTYTMTGYFTTVCMLSNSCNTNIASLTASDKAMYSASELESETLFCDFNVQETNTTLH